MIRAGKYLCFGWGNETGQGLACKDGLFRIIDLLHSLEMSWWLDGGWGVDVPYGEQTREHRDIEINFDAAVPNTCPASSSPLPIS